MSPGQALSFDRAGTLLRALSGWRRRGCPALTLGLTERFNMAVHAILKMGDARLLRVAQPVLAFDTPELHALVADMQETMVAANGAGLAAPQIGVDLQLVIFGFQRNERYPEAPPVPLTVLINPQISPLSDEMVEGREGCLSVPGLRGQYRAGPASVTPALTCRAALWSTRPRASMRGWYSTSATTWSASCTRCAFATSASSGIPACCFPGWTHPKTTERRRRFRVRPVGLSGGATG